MTPTPPLSYIATLEIEGCIHLFPINLSDPQASEDGEPEPECFLQCRGEGCLQRHCCQSTPTSSQEDLQVVACIGAAHGHSHGGHGHAHAGGHGHSHAGAHKQAKVSGEQ